VLRAPSIHAVVGQVRRAFGDRRILSASVEGSSLDVRLAAPDEPSRTNAAFEGQMLAHAVADWQRAHGRKPIDAVRYLDSKGAQLALSQLTDPVTADASVSPLARTACRSAAEAAQAKQLALDRVHLTVVSAKTLPYDNGACVVAFRTPDPTAFAGGAPLTIGKLATVLGDPNERPYLVQAVDEAGTPQFVASFVPGGEGQAYIRPGLPTAFAGAAAGLSVVPPSAYAYQLPIDPWHPDNGKWSTLVRSRPVTVGYRIRGVFSRPWVVAAVESLPQDGQPAAIRGWRGKRNPTWHGKLVLRPAD
jgi:hypothetical protein